MKLHQTQTLEELTIKVEIEIQTVQIILTFGLNLPPKNKSKTQIGFWR